MGKKTDAQIKILAHILWKVIIPNLSFSSKNGSLNEVKNDELE